MGSVICEAILLTGFEVGHVGAFRRPEMAEVFMDFGFINERVDGELFNSLHEFSDDMYICGILGQFLSDENLGVLSLMEAFKIILTSIMLVRAALSAEHPISTFTSGLSGFFSRITTSIAEMACETYTKSKGVHNDRN